MSKWGRLLGKRRCQSHRKKQWRLPGVVLALGGGGVVGLALGGGGALVLVVVGAGSKASGTNGARGGVGTSGTNGAHGREPHLLNIKTVGSPAV